MSPEFGIIFPLFQDGWITYLDMVCVDLIVKIELEYLLLEFLCKEGFFSIGEALLRESMLRLVSLWEKYGRQVPYL